MDQLVCILVLLKLAAPELIVGFGSKQDSDKLVQFCGSNKLVIDYVQALTVILHALNVRNSDLVL